MCKNNKPSFYCKKCNFRLNKKVKVCPKCGCDNKLAKMNFSGELKLRGTLRGLKYISGKIGWVKEVLAGWFPSNNKKKHPEGVEKYRVVDKEHKKEEDSYQENIKDIRTGKTIRDIKEPLEKHRNY